MTKYYLPKKIISKYTIQAIKILKNNLWIFIKKNNKMIIVVKLYYNKTIIKKIIFKYVMQGLI